MVAEKEDGVKSIIETLHHVHGLVLAAQQRSSAVQQIRLQIAHAAMRVVDEKLISAGLRGSVDRRVYFSH
jgi:hypothetical protein